MKSIWKRDPELSYIGYNPKSEKEPARIEPVERDENGELMIRRSKKRSDSSI